MEQAAAELAQQFVAQRVAQRVVDVLEAVEVDEQHGDDPVVLARLGQRIAERFVEQAAVRQARQRIEMRQAHQLRDGAGLAAVGAVQKRREQHDHQADDAGAPEIAQAALFELGQRAVLGRTDHGQQREAVEAAETVQAAHLVALAGTDDGAGAVPLALVDQLRRCIDFARGQPAALLAGARDAVQADQHQHVVPADDGVFVEFGEAARFDQQADHAAEAAVGLVDAARQRNQLRAEHARDHRLADVQLAGVGGQVGAEALAIGDVERVDRAVVRAGDVVAVLIEDQHRTIEVVVDGAVGEHLAQVGAGAAAQVLAARVGGDHVGVAQRPRRELFESDRQVRVALHDVVDIVLALEACLGQHGEPAGADQGQRADDDGGAHA
jgi:hypothetical protein